MHPELDIINMNPEKTRPHPLKHSHLPSPEQKFRLLVFGQSHSGKGNMLKNLIMRFGMAEYYNKEIFIVSETYGVEKNGWECLELPPGHYLNTYDEQIIKEMMTYSEKVPQGTLMIFDDMAASQAVNKYKNTLVDRLFFQARHHGMSVIFTSQNYKSCSVKMRNNASHVICYALTNVSARKTFCYDNADVKSIEQKTERCWREPYGFIYIDRSSGREKSAYNCFKELLTDGDSGDTEDNDPAGTTDTASDAMLDGIALEDEPPAVNP